TSTAGSTRSISTSKPPSFHGMNLVVSPRGDTRSETCHQWFRRGASASRILPSIWATRWIVSFVGLHASSGSDGSGASRPMATSVPIVATREAGTLPAREADSAGEDAGFARETAGEDVGLADRLGEAV